MKIKKEIKDQLKQIESNDLLHQSVATIDINAPVALMQMGLEAQSKALRWVLNLQPSTELLKRKKNK